eukprot:3077694-Alexandrium_andersonii.AAC.1
MAMPAVAVATAGATGECKRGDRRRAALHAGAARVGPSHAAVSVHCSTDGASVRCAGGRPATTNLGKTGY